MSQLRLGAAGGWVASGVLALLALAVRALPWRTVLEPDRVVFFGNDAYYHARRILYAVQHFPEILHYDPTVNFPAGGQPIWSPLFDALCASVARGLAGATDVAAMERVLVWSPPVLGALTVVVVYALARAHFGRGAAWLAALLLAFLPAHSAYSQIGFVDHHAAVALGFALLLAVGMTTARRGVAEPVGLRDGLVIVPSLAAAVAGALLLWPGMLLHVGVLEIGLVALVASRPHAAQARRLALLLAVAHGVALAAVAPFAWNETWRLWSRASPVVLSRFQPWLLGSIALWFASFALLSRGQRERPPGRRVVDAALALLAVLLLSAPLLSALGTAAGDAWQWMARRETFQAEVLESQPLLVRRGRLDFANAALSLTGLFFLLPLPLALAVRSFGARPAHPAGLLLAGFTLALGVASLAQTRFSNCLAVAMALLLGWWLAGVASRVAASWRRSRVRGAALAAGLAALGTLLVLPSFPAYAPFVRQNQLWLQGRPPELTPFQQRKRQLIETASWLREHSPSTPGFDDASQRPEYGVLSHWADGHVLRYVARRPVVVDNFGDDVGRRNFRLSELYYLASEAQASTLLDRLRARYVVFEFRRVRSRAHVGPGSTLARLYFRDGEAGDASVAVREGAVREVQGDFPAAERHRLVFETAPRPGVEGSVQPAFKLYEHVKGARVRGAAPPGASVEAQLDVETNRGRRFVWLARTEADAAGRYELRVPYATRGAPPGVRTARHFVLRSAGAEARLAVEERDVLEGRSLAGPSFGPDGRSPPTPPQP